MSKKRGRSKQKPAQVQAIPEEILAEGSGPVGDDVVAAELAAMAEVAEDAEAQVREAQADAGSSGDEQDADESVIEAAGEAAGEPAVEDGADTRASRKASKGSKKAGKASKQAAAAADKDDDGSIDATLEARDQVSHASTAELPEISDDDAAVLADGEDATDADVLAAEVDATAGDMLVASDVLADRDDELATDDDDDDAIHADSDDSADDEVLAVDDVSEGIAFDADETLGDDEDLAAEGDLATLPTSAASMDAVQLKQLIEALVFASDKPMTIQRLRQLTRVADVRRLELMLTELAAEYADRGLVLQQVSGGYQFRTRPQFSAWVQQLIAGRPVRLSRAQLETLAIVAYRQPITRPEIDDIRGVDSSATLKLLMDRALIRVLGKKEEVGRPMLYGTTKEFLDFFSLGDLRELPTLREYSELSDESRKVMSHRLGIPMEDPVSVSSADDDGDNGEGGKGGSGGGEGGGGSGEPFDDGDLGPPESSDSADAGDLRATSDDSSEDAMSADAVSADAVSDEVMIANDVSDGAGSADAADDVIVAAEPAETASEDMTADAASDEGISAEAAESVIAAGAASDDVVSDASMFDDSMAADAASDDGVAAEIGPVLAEGSSGHLMTADDGPMLDVASMMTDEADLERSEAPEVDPLIAAEALAQAEAMKSSGESTE
ncbi:MAG: chromosome segregation and condensation protein ScpB [Myxococcales bacterium]|nr:chromosome segregation and condensation protein ScpB [Myxococcales bacterium]